MNINATLLINLALINVLIMVPLTIMFAKQKTDNLLLVGFFSTILNFLVAPLGWIYCGFWSLKSIPEKS